MFPFCCANSRNTKEGGSVKGMGSSTNKKTNSFVLQAGILAAAGMIVKVIGLIYRSPLLSIIGLEGNNYYSAAINIYTIILLISSYSIPSAISKVIAQRLAFKEYRNCLLYTSPSPRD